MLLPHHGVSVYNRHRRHRHRHCTVAVVVSPTESAPWPSPSRRYVTDGWHCIDAVKMTGETSLRTGLVANTNPVTGEAVIAYVPLSGYGPEEFDNCTNVTVTKMVVVNETTDEQALMNVTEERCSPYLVYDGIDALTYQQVDRCDGFTIHPTAVPTAVPTPLPSQLPTPVPSPLPTPRPTDIEEAKRGVRCIQTPDAKECQSEDGVSCHRRGFEILSLRERLRKA